MRTKHESAGSNVGNTLDTLSLQAVPELRLSTDGDEAAAQ